MEQPANTASPAAKPQFSSAFNLFKPSMAVLGINFVPIIAALGIPFALSLLSTMLGGGNAYDLQSGGQPSQSLSPLGIMLSAASVVLGIILTPALYIAQLEGSRNKKIEFGEAFRRGRPFILRVLGVSILQTLAIIAGLILLIVPGLFMLRRYLLAPLYTVDQNLGVLESMKRSAADSKVYSGSIWGLIGVWILISLPWLVPFIGWVAAAVLYFMYLCSSPIRYLQIESVKAGAEPQAPIERSSTPAA